MTRIMLVVLVAFSAASFAQADGGMTAVPANDVESLRREFEAKLEAASREVKDLREEIQSKAQAQSAMADSDWMPSRRKLELLTVDGYLRVRPELFDRLSLDRPADPAGYSLWPQSSVSASDKTNAGVNMRFRFEPTLNVSEEVRVRAQIDALDNVVWGTTPDYAFSRNSANGYWYDRNDFSVFSSSQVPPRSGINSLQDSISLKRVWGEVATPVGILRFGRMGSHWGLGMLHNDGNGIDNDWGDTVDRVSFTAEPLAGFYITPMIDFNIEGLTSTRMPEGGQPFDLSNLDDGHSYILAAARRDTETERIEKLNAGTYVFNYGIHFMYRNQHSDAAAYLAAPWLNEGNVSSSSTVGTVRRSANLFIPDLWAKFEMKDFRIEAEVAAVLGAIDQRTLPVGDGANFTAAQALSVVQFGGVLQGEYRFLNGDLEIGAELGFASGDKAPGFGNYPRRRGKQAGSSASGDVIDGPQYTCDASGSNCADAAITNFRFNRDYRADLILYRELLGGITDSFYVKPKAKYRITQGFEAFVGAMYSRAIDSTSVPGIGTNGQRDASLGIELSGGARYETEDGFFGQVQYGALFPLGGFKWVGANLTDVNPEVAQAIRGSIGIRF